MKWIAIAIFAGLALVAVAKVGQATNPPPAPPAQYLPTYSASYRGDDPAIPILRDLLASQKRQEAYLKGIYELTGKQASAEAKPASLKALLNQRCAECHKEGTEAARKNAVVMVLADGSVPPLSLAEKRLIKRVVESGEMPKGKPLSDVERAFLLEQLFGASP